MSDRYSQPSAHSWMRDASPCRPTSSWQSENSTLNQASDWGSNSIVNNKFLRCRRQRQPEARWTSKPRANAGHRCSEAFRRPTLRTCRASRYSSSTMCRRVITPRSALMSSSWQLSSASAGISTPGSSPAIATAWCKASEPALPPPKLLSNTRESTCSRNHGCPASPRGTHCALHSLKFARLPMLQHAEFARSAHTREQAVMQFQPHPGQHRIMNRKRHLWLHHPHIINRLADLEPRRSGRRCQNLHRPVRYRVRIARVKQPPGNQISHIGNIRDLRMDHDMQLANRLHRHPGDVKFIPCVHSLHRHSGLLEQARRIFVG